MTARPNGAPWGKIVLVAVPLVFFGYFFVYPLTAILWRGLAGDGFDSLRRVLTNVNPIEGMELLSERVGSFEDNDTFLLSLKS